MKQQLENLWQGIKTAGKWFLWYQAISFGVALIGVTIAAIWWPEEILKFTGMG